MESRCGVLNDFLVTWSGVERRKECAFPMHYMRAAARKMIHESINISMMIPSCAVCTIPLPVSNSLAPSIQHLHASNKTVVEYLATVSPELKLANGSLFKACFTKLPYYGREHKK